MQRLGIIDLGSNTARLVVFSYEQGQWFRLADQIREPARLGEGLGRDGKLAKSAQTRAARALELFSDYARNTGVSRLEVLATSALRDATNRQDFLDRIRHLGLDISILDGEEEAELGVLAVANSFQFEDAWIVDLGGGSAQISQMRARQFVEGKAYPLGAVRLTEKYLRSDPARGKETRHLEDALAKRLGPVVSSINQGDQPLVAMGGTIRNLARAVQKERAYPLSDRIHGYFLERGDLEGLVDRLLTTKAKRRGQIPGIKADRADIIVAGALVCRWLLRQTDREGFWISGLGLREGALFRRFLPAPYLLHDLRGFSVQNLLHHYAQPKEHVRLTRRLSASLFSELRPIHGFGAREANLLDAGVVLQDIGLAVNIYRHDRHGEYLVSSAPLNGFTHREQALIALLVRYHLRGKPRLGHYETLCLDSDQRLLWTLAACLRIADHLERPRARRVEDLVVEIREEEIVLRPVASEELPLELWDLEQHQDLFRLAFERELVVEPIIRRQRIEHQD
jgi:exopolyphosphatase/guanosine-5'-triphosphate,3'-diphosphate pyrophosphatase